MVRAVPRFIIVLLLAELATGFVFKDRVNETAEEIDNELKTNDEPLLRRQADGTKKKKSESTSSSGKRNVKESKSAGSSAESLAQEFSQFSSTDSDDKKRAKKELKPKSTAERKGWRKWHRKCTPCPEDMRKKWRDPSIKWICGAYQRARRSFKSSCMMYLRNCQDGTMFVKIADHRCPNASGQVLPHGDHFFYDYHVDMSEDDTESDNSGTTSEASDSSSWDASKIATIPAPSD